jgi:hypothetical protein
MANIPTPAEAREILARFNASHFRTPDREHARYRIPADPAHDDDIRLAAFIDQAEKIAKVANQLAAALERADSLNTNADYWGKEINGIGQTQRKLSQIALGAYAAL